MPPFTRKEILTELLRRKRATESLVDFTEYTYGRYRTAPHHAIIAERLERVQRGESKRLMLLLPPRLLPLPRPRWLTARWISTA